MVSAVPSRVSLLISILRRLNLVLTYGIPPEFRGGVHFFILEGRRGRPGQTSPGEKRGNETGKVAIAHGSVEFCEATPIGLADES